MQQKYIGQLHKAELKRFALVASRFNESIVKNLVSGALDTLERHGVPAEQITTIWVPGAFEIPVIAKRLAFSSQIDAVICLGAIIRGATPHFECVVNATATGIAKIALDSGVPCIFGVLTTNSIEEAIERAGTKSGNKGADAALSAIEMVDLLSQLPNAVLESELCY